MNRRHALIGWLVASAFLAPVIGTFLRRRNQEPDEQVCPRMPWEPFIIDDLVKPGRGTSPEIWEWYQNYMASKAAQIDMEVRPCGPIECPPMEEVEINWTGPNPDYVPGTFAREVAEYYNVPQLDEVPTGPALRDMIADFLAEFEPKAAAAIETACEQAIQTGYMGVLVRRGIEFDPTNPNDSGVMFVEAQATPEVAYGYIRDDGMGGRLRSMGIIGFDPPSPDDVWTWDRP